MALIGKTVADDYYVHLSAISAVDAPLQARVEEALACLAHLTIDGPNVVKLNRRSGRLSLLNYPGFFEDPFPALAGSWSFTSDSTVVPVFRSYSQSLNPPILHRKELLVGPSHWQFKAWSELTTAAEQLGLFDDTSTIGFRTNWDRMLEAKGYQMFGNALVPLGNDIGTDLAFLEHQDAGHRPLQRHRTALSRTNLSAPVQLLGRHGFLQPGTTFFDYGCGRGGDIEGLTMQGLEATGWDPYFRPETTLSNADVVNLGFVVNVIEDAAERIEALTRAFRLARTVLSVSVMLYTANISGKPYRDGFVTSRETFQKYFSQDEFKDYLEHVLQREPVMVGPGVAFVFTSSDIEQRFIASRFRTRGMVSRLLVTKHRADKRQHLPVVRTPRAPVAERRRAEIRPILDEFWEATLDLGRWPEPDEISQVLRLAIDGKLGGHSRALRLLSRSFDKTLLLQAAATRADDVRVMLAAQQFDKRHTYRQLEVRLQRDIKIFYGDYKTAREAGVRLLIQAADPVQLLEACQHAAVHGLGWLDGVHSLQLHVSLVDRLPALLRAYVAASLVLWDALSDVQMVKIHISSGKLTLMEFVDFDSDPLPRLKRRIKVNVRKLECDLFEYGSETYPMPILYRKSRYLHEDQPEFAEQLALDAALDEVGIPGDSAYGPTPSGLDALLESKRLTIKGINLRRSERIPSLDSACGMHHTYRSFIDCGETQRRIGGNNLPLNPATYNALFDLATHILDPVIEYFGAIELTYGFASAQLVRQIPGRIASKLDQHAACEHGRSGKLICERGGAACDFLVVDEDMREVAQWICANLPFDRLYFYGTDLPVHVSFSSTPVGQAFDMVFTSNGRRMPRPFV